jgi:hypothetical protein
MVIERIFAVQVFAESVLEVLHVTEHGPDSLRAVIIT